MRLAHRPRLRSLFHSLILLAGCVCLTATALLPLTGTALPDTADGATHLYRGLALEHALRVDHGIWQRYAPGLAYGYGAPLFHYFSPLAYYPMALLHQIGISFVAGWQWTTALCSVLGAAGAFLLARRWSGQDLGGWIAALAYAQSPYFLLDSLTRGALAELVSLAVLPWVIYAFARLAADGTRLNLFLALATLALFIPLHTVMTLHGVALLMACCLFLAWQSQDRRRSLIHLLLAGGLALALTAFYWLPALLESDQIKLSLIREQLGHIDATRHLRPVHALLSLPFTADPSQQNHATPIGLGLPQLGLAAMSTTLCLRRAERRHRPLLALLWLLLIALAFMNTPASASLWENLPLIGYTQFPWRLLGLASLALACLCGIGVCLLWRALPSGLTRWLLLPGIGAAIAIYGLPWTFTAHLHNFHARDIRDVHAFERETGQLALGSYAEYLPLSADAARLDARRLIDRYATADAIERLQADDNLAILSADWRGLAADLRLRSQSSRTLIFDWLYVPGWRAELDGQAIAVYPNAAGLVALDLPAGESNLRVYLGATGIQRAAEIISGAALLGTVALLWLWRGPATTAQGLALDWRLAALVMALGVGVVLLRIALHAGDSVFKSSRFGDVQGASALANFGDQIDLLAVDLPPGDMDEPQLALTLYWRLHDSRLPRDYSSILRLLDPAGHVVAQRASFALGGLATRNWQVGRYVIDDITLPIPPFTPPLPEAYQLEVALYDTETLRELSLLNAKGDPQAASFALGSRFYRPSAASRARELAELKTTGESNGGAADLIEAPTLPREASVGDELRFGWAWRKTSELDDEPGARLLWLDDNSAVIGMYDIGALVTGYPFAAWRPGEVNRGHHSAILPPHLPAGDYTLGLRLLDANGDPAGAILPLAKSMTVTAPARDFNAPIFVEADIAAWDNGIALAGYRLGDGGHVELAWRTERLQRHSLRLFVHALDADERIAAQWDGVPADWTRPTTGWLPGEYVRGSHHLDLPAGQYRVRVGWYHPRTDERIGVGDGDSLLLDEALRVE